MNTCDVIDSSWMVVLRVRRELIPVRGLAGRYGSGIANHEFGQVRRKAWNRCEFHALDTCHGYDEHPVGQVNLELLANQKFLQSGGGRHRINFRRLEFKTLRRPVLELDGDCGRNSLEHCQCPFLLVGLHNLPHSMCGNRAVWPAVRLPRVGVLVRRPETPPPVEMGSDPRETELMPSNRRSASNDVSEDWASLICSC